jgi:hypothetical protein
MKVKRSAQFVILNLQLLPSAPPPKLKVIMILLMSICFGCWMDELLFSCAAMLAQVVFHPGPLTRDPAGKLGK